MDYLNQNISINLKKIRLARGYSLDQVAEQTGVSKSMLGQIERGTANPTIGILGKIVSGLRVELNDLVKTPGEGVFPVCKEWLLPTKELKDAYRVYTYFPYEKERNFELYVIEVEPGAVYYSGAHGENTKEYVIVETGELWLNVGRESYCVKAGDAIRFDSDKDHEYLNKGETELRLVSIFSYTV
ncbi:MAG: helix-turn-helix domain-containing protein [Lachnospiraceae bacterium]